jgi:hypothetical protein
MSRIARPIRRESVAVSPCCAASRCSFQRRFSILVSQFRYVALTGKLSFSACLALIFLWAFRGFVFLIAPFHGNQAPMTLVLPSRIRRYVLLLMRGCLSSFVASAGNAIFSIFSHSRCVAFRFVSKHTHYRTLISSHAP